MVDFVAVEFGQAAQEEEEKILPAGRAAAD